MKLVYLAILCLMLTGCGCTSIGGENLLVVKGKISSELLAGGCQIEFNSDIYSSSGSYSISPIDSTDFKVEYLVSPLGGTYRVVLACRERIVKEVKISTASALTEIDISP